MTISSVQICEFGVCVFSGKPWEVMRIDGEKVYLKLVNGR